MLDVRKPTPVQDFTESGLLKGQTGIIWHKEAEKALQEQCNDPGGFSGFQLEAVVSKDPVASIGNVA